PARTNQCCNADNGQANRVGGNNKIKHQHLQGQALALITSKHKHSKLIPFNFNKLTGTHI
ncbi:hypothetical protein, partial [Marinagarivorans algicola]|uniref:hypothetical protein n=1 Tax=Marinagarivorans algicola TaxID=1513270 RepID=UPI00373587BF